MSLWANIEKEIRGLFSSDQASAVETAIKAEIAKVTAEAKAEAARVKADVLAGVSEAVPVVKADLEAGVSKVAQALITVLEKRL